MNRIASYLAPVIAAATLGVVSNDAHSGVNGPGLQFKTAFASDAGCLSRNTGYADIINNCTYAVEIGAALPVLSEGWHNTSVWLLGSNTWCQSVTINAVGNGAQVGPATWTVAGPPTWQVLNLGSRFVWANTSLEYRCVLEPHGVIGEYLSE